VGPRCSLCTACGKRCGADDAPFKIVAVLPLDELDGEAVG
jgi:heterodisulfide reductase subunit C